MTTLPPESAGSGSPADAAGPPHRQRQVAEGFGADPDPRMAEQARQGGTEVEVAKFEDWDPAGRAFDAVVAAQSWHWVDLVAGAAKAAAALRPGGRLAVLWNAFGPPRELREAFAGVYRQVVPDSPLSGFWTRPAIDTYRAGGARAADGIRQAGGVGEPEEWVGGRAPAPTRARRVAPGPPPGGFRQSAPDVQAELLAGLGAAVDAAGGAFTMGYTTLAVTAARL